MIRATATDIRRHRNVWPRFLCAVADRRVFMEGGEATDSPAWDGGVVSTPGGHLVEGGEAVGHLGPYRLLGGGAADVGAQSADLSDAQQCFESVPVADVPAVGGGELLDLLIGVPGEAAVHVVDLDEIPLARADRRMVPIARQYPSTGQRKKVVGVGVRMDQPRRVWEVQPGPVVAQPPDPLQQPCPVGSGHRIGVVFDGGRHPGERVVQCRQ